MSAQQRRLEACTREAALDRPHRLFIRYAYPASALLSVTGIAVAWVASRPLGGVLYFIPLSAVILVGAFAGRAPGILAVAISGVGMWLINFSLGPASLWRDVAERNQFLAFGVVALLMTLSAARVQHARLRAEMEREHARRVAERLRVSQELTAALSSAHTTEQVADALLRSAPMTLAASAGAILVFDGERHLRVLRTFGYAPDDERTWAAVPMDAEAPLADAFRTNEPVWLRSARERDALYPGVWAEPAGAGRAWAAVPLAVDGRPFGALAMSFRSAHAIDRDGQRHVGSIASKLAQALDRARLYESEQGARRTAEVERENARRHSARSEMLASLTLDLATGTGLEHVLSTAVPRTADLLGGEDASLFLIEDGGAVLVGAFEVQPKERTGARLPLADCPHVRAAVASGRPRLFRRTDARGAERAWMERLSIDGALATPLAAHGQTVGVLFVNYGAPPPLGHDDLAFASALASTCALAITRAQAFQHERAAREAADRALEQLREADRRKDEFLAMLSHELRNPLTPIRNSLYLLARAGPVTERGARAREIIERQVLHLSRLVDDLLDVTRISRGKIQVHRAAVELKKLVARTAEDHRGAFDQARVALAVHAEGGPAWVHADATRLAQAIGNVLSNAAKFTPEGGHVEVRVEADDENAFVRVRDDGIGIDDSMLPHVFDVFAQADRSLARTRGGLGLGLSLVKGLVELHGGAVSASSDGPGMGAEFTVSLPLAARPERDAPASARPEVSGGRRVLIIEDNHDAADTLREALETFGHQVQVAYDGVDGLEKAHAATPEVVLCDIGLPSINGYEVARRFRADPELRSSALIALSGYASGDDQRRAAQAGFDLHIAKPPTLEQLQEAIVSAPVAGTQGVV